MTRATIQYKPVTSLADNQTHSLIMNSHMASIKNHMHYPIFMACTGAAACNLLDISVYSLNPGKLPGRFSYERTGFKARGTVKAFKTISMYISFLQETATASHFCT